MKIADVQFKNGDVTELDFQQAKIILNKTLATIPVLKANIGKSKNALSVLLGRTPGSVDSLISPFGNQ